MSPFLILVSHTPSAGGIPLPSRFYVVLWTQWVPKNTNIEGGGDFISDTLVF